jgi:hypothetical protein
MGWYWHIIGNGRRGLEREALTEFIGRRIINIRLNHLDGPLLFGLDLDLGHNIDVFKRSELLSTLELKVLGHILNLLVEFWCDQDLLRRPLK